MKTLPCCKCGKPTDCHDTARKKKCPDCYKADMKQYRKAFYARHGALAIKTECECGWNKGPLVKFHSDWCCPACKEKDLKRAINEKKHLAKIKKEREQWAIQERRELTLAKQGLDGLYEGERWT